MSETKTKSTKTEEASPKPDNLKAFNFTRDNIVVKAKTRKEAEKLLKEIKSKEKEEDK